MQGGIIGREILLMEGVIHADHALHCMEEKSPGQVKKRKKRSWRGINEI